jgi:hypothetical protein
MMAMPEDADPRSKELDAQLRALTPENELAYRYLYREHSPSCRLDPAWRARIAEILGRLDAEAWRGPWRAPPNSAGN